VETVNFTGKNLINGEWVADGSVTFSAFNPADLVELNTQFIEANSLEVTSACVFAHEAFVAYKSIGFHQRIQFIETIIEEIKGQKENLLHFYQLETGLSAARAKVEFDRTIFQFSSYLDDFKKGWALNCVIENSDHSGFPDLRKMNIPLGPVVVFGASNFPFAYSTLGGDVASALIAGCPVIVKAHPMHPHVCELSANVILNALKKSNFPLGMFQQINAESFEISKELVRNEFVKAVGFTGSIKGGNAIQSYINERKEPIPLFAEMGSTNPVLVFQDALEQHSEEIAKKLVDSFTLSAGQFCTSPGIVVCQKSDLTTNFIETLVHSTREVLPQRMLHPRILEGYENQLNKRKGKSTILLTSSNDLNDFTAQIESVDLNEFVLNETLNEEVFGSYLLIVLCESEIDFNRFLKHIEGQLTISVFSNNVQILDEISEKAGRIIFNNVPTGVSVSSAMQHGGPYPSSSRVDSSSVGSQAIQRFMRPICYQSFNEKDLPEALRNTNNFGIFRKVNGNWEV
jgi:alpha-ketoglutaric semialdehyde dehydrogenase